jgi:hypothetical protein
MEHTFMTETFNETVTITKKEYEPLHFDEVDAKIKKRWEDTGYAPTVRLWGNGKKRTDG